MEVKKFEKEISDHLYQVIIQEIEANFSKVEKNFCEELSRINSDIMEIADEKIKDASFEIRELKRKAEFDIIRSTQEKRLNLIEDIVTDILSKVVEKVSTIRNTKRYKQSLENFLREGMLFMKSDEVQVLCNQEDHEFVVNLIEKLSSELGVSLELSNECLECEGGLLIKSKDGLVTYDTTIETRLQNLHSKLKMNIVRALTGGS